MVAGVTPSQLQHMPIFLAYILLVYCSGRLAQLFKNGREAITQLCFWSFIYIFLALPAASELIARHLPIPGQVFSTSI